VTLSYRREAFSRLKDRNEQRIAESMKSGKVQVIFNSQPVEIGDRTVQLDVGGEIREIPNDYVWVFAGGTPPSEFLGKIGIQIGPRDLTAVAGAEAKLVSDIRRLAG
jgi:thioredoxin reductase